MGTLAGCTAVRVLENFGFSASQIKTYQDQDGPYADLSMKRGIRAVLLDLPAAIYYTKPYPQLDSGRVQGFPGAQFLGQPFAAGRYGIAVKQAQ